LAATSVGASSALGWRRRARLAGLRGSGPGRGPRLVAVRARREKKKDPEDARTKVRLSEFPQGSDFYTVLGVERNSSQEDIRAAYKRAIRETHPDVDPSLEAADRFMSVQEAFRWLSDPSQRTVYDGIGSKFGKDALYDFTDDPILGKLSEVTAIGKVMHASHMVNKCRRELARGGKDQAVRIDYNQKDKRNRFRKWGAERISWVRDFFVAELRRVLDYPRVIKELHPFERLSVELSLHCHMQEGGLAFGKLMGALKTLRAKVTEEGSMRAYHVKRAERGRDATLMADAAIEELYNIMLAHEPVIQQFSEAQYCIFQTPCIDLDKPTVVFVGAPNVGKSSLVRSISTGRPEVKNEVFTTKRLTVGHIWHFVRGTPLLVQGQIVDSPGLRVGIGGNHNLFDQLTMGSLQHLPTAVVFVFDPLSWYTLLTLDEQIELRESLRNQFPKRPWLDVITKVDLAEETDLGCDEDAIKGIERLSALYPEAIKVSALEGTGLAELNMEVRRLLEEMTRVVRQLQRAKIRQMRLGMAREPVTKEALSMRELV